MPVIYTSREEYEVYRFSPAVSIALPLIAIFLQGALPLRFPFLAIFDLPLLVTIFFAVGRRNQVAGLLTGGIIGILQDAYTSHPLGVFGIAKTIVGYAASSLGLRIDVENIGTRFLMTVGFYMVHQVMYYSVMRILVAKPVATTWTHELGAALANALLGLVVYAILDRFKHRA